MGSALPGHLQKYLDEIVLVSEEDLAAAFRIILFRAKLAGEPAGVVAPAACFTGKVDGGRKTIALQSGGNVTESVVQKMLQMSAYVLVVHLDSSRSSFFQDPSSCSGFTSEKRRVQRVFRSR